MRAFLGVKSGLLILVRVKDFTFSNSVLILLMLLLPLSIPMFSPSLLFTF